MHLSLFDKTKVAVLLALSIHLSKCYLTISRSNNLSKCKRQFEREFKHLYIWAWRPACLCPMMFAVTDASIEGRCRRRGKCRDKMRPERISGIINFHPRLLILIGQGHITCYPVNNDIGLKQLVSSGTDQSLQYWHKLCC